jgi:hypothetical protein
MEVDGSHDFCRKAWMVCKQTRARSSMK